MPGHSHAQTPPSARVTIASAPAPVRLGARAIPYGWVIVAALSVTETVTWGIVYYGFPVFLRPMEQDLGASRVAVTGAFSVGLGVSALAALPVGRWIDRHGARGLMTMGSCLGALLTLAWARVESLPALYAVWFLMGLAMVATLYEPAFAVVVSWFAEGRARALLTVTLVAGLASTIFMPIEAWLLVRMGWRSAVTVLAIVLAAVTIPIHALLLRRGPGGQAQGGAKDEGSSRPSGLTLREAAGTLVFWVLVPAFFVSNFATAALSTHLIPYLVGLGYSATISHRGRLDGGDAAGRACDLRSHLGAPRLALDASRGVPRAGAGDWPAPAPRGDRGDHPRSWCCRAPQTGWRRSLAPPPWRRSSGLGTTAPSRGPSRSAPMAHGPLARSAPRSCGSGSAPTPRSSGCSPQDSWSPPSPC
jgi:MFS family permease